MKNKDGTIIRDLEEIEKEHTREVYFASTHIIIFSGFGFTFGSSADLVGVSNPLACSVHPACTAICATAWTDLRNRSKEK